MENKRLLTAQDVMEMLDVSLSYAYKLIRRLNAEFESEGFVTMKRACKHVVFYGTNLRTVHRQGGGIDGGYQEQKDRNVGGENLL